MTHPDIEALAERIVEAVTDAANLVTVDGYYEIDQEAACRAVLPILTDIAAKDAEIAAYREALEEAIDYVKGCVGSSYCDTGKDDEDFLAKLEALANRGEAV